MNGFNIEPMFNTATLEESAPADWYHFINEAYAVDEDDLMSHLIKFAEPNGSIRSRTQDRARKLVEKVRANAETAHAVDKLLQEYSLDVEEGVVLMCLAEALMRIPDKRTADALIRDKLSPAKWQEHMGRSDSLFVNASTWGLMLTGRVTGISNREKNPANLLAGLIQKTGEPVIRSAMSQAMKVIGKQFVLGRDIKEAIANGKLFREKGYTYSFDMLGEAALIDADADRYYNEYMQAIRTIAEKRSAWKADQPKPNISIKLSALHPRYEETHEHWVMEELAGRVCQLVEEARSLDVPVTIDAEEADRLELSLRLFQKVYNSPAAKGWGFFGLVIQAYSKRALGALGFINALAREQGDEIPVRLVKGAYWDSEIKHAQQLGLSDYPVFTRKENSDVAYLACARFLLSTHTEGLLYPQFATHNAHTVSAIIELAKDSGTRSFEFQRLHGMGDSLYDVVMAAEKVPVRIYAPVGAHKDLLPYLVRRLLENGANSSFVHKLIDPNIPVEQLIVSPVETAEKFKQFRNPLIPKPDALFGKDRTNSRGFNLNVAKQREPLLADISKFASHKWQFHSLVDGVAQKTATLKTISQPYNRSIEVGQLSWATAELAKKALTSADKAWFSWNKTPVVERAACLDRLADLMEEHTPEFIALCCREAGKTLQDSIDEVREAVDFCRYYSQQARDNMDQPTVLPSVTGERNEHYYEGRGVFVCISPWNFPLAIFTGQISAALVAGNTVLAKPAEQTSLIAARAIELFHKAGVPANVLQLLIGSGADIGGAVLTEPEVVGVAFTGSTETAHRINRMLAERTGAIPTFIAETGGQNAMIVDSTALPEQVVTDVMQSAFASAGQRCSALRVLCIQEDIADRVLELIKGAMQRFVVGNPEQYSTDSGPVIDEKARENLQAYVEQWRSKGKVMAEAELSDSASEGYFVKPTVIELNSIDELGREQFGPILHFHRYSAKKLDELIESINKTGYGLTLGIHSRNEATVSYIERRIRVGNCYVNRNQIGAVVGSQPFGGRGLSGTGPKAGGPNYLKRFATERVRTINTTAVGGNATLLSLKAND